MVSSFRTSGRFSTKLPSGSPKTVPPPKKKICVAIPSFNEEDNIGAVLHQLKNMGYKNLIVIDAPSQDDTTKIAAEHGAKIIIQDGHGKGQAIRQVLSMNFSDSDILVFMDADGSMSPTEVPHFIEAVCKGGDVVKGTRFATGGGSYDITPARKIGNTIMTSIVNILFSTRFSDLCYGFFALNKKAIKKLSPLLVSNGFEIETEISIKAKKLGLNVVEIPSIEYRRTNGYSNLNTFRDGFKILKTILAESFKN